MKDMTAGDMATAVGGVGGTGDMSFLRLTLDQASVSFSRAAGMTRGGRLRRGGPVLCLDPSACRVLLGADFLDVGHLDSSSSDDMSRSSNSVTSVMVLARFFHRLDDAVSEAASSSVESVEGDDGRIGAAIKCMPRGVGKWSLMGDIQATILEVTGSSSRILLRAPPLPR
jgi:hypothetical protein